MRLIRAQPMSANDPANIRDCQPSPGALDTRALVPEGPKDLSPAEVAVLRALHRGCVTTALVLAQCDGDDAVRPAIDRLVQRGLVSRVGDTGHEFQLTTPHGANVAAALANLTGA